MKIIKLNEKDLALHELESGDVFKIAYPEPFLWKYGEVFITTGYISEDTEPNEREKIICIALEQNETIALDCEEQVIKLETELRIIGESND